MKAIISFCRRKSAQLRTLLVEVMRAMKELVIVLQRALEQKGL